MDWIGLDWIRIDRSACAFQIMVAISHHLSILPHGYHSIPASAHAAAAAATSPAPGAIISAGPGFGQEGVGNRSGCCHDFR